MEQNDIARATQGEAMTPGVAHQDGTIPDPPPQPAERLTSLDALRGFDMLCILGIDRLLRSLAQTGDSAVLKGLAAQMNHVPWAGLHFYDLIFPLFLFIVGVSLVFSLDRAIEWKGRGAAILRVVRRSILLFALGVFYMGGLAGGWSNVYLAGVLQRIAEAYLLAALIFCWLKERLSAMIVACLMLLVGYWALLTFVPVPGIGSASYERGKNLAHYIDVRFLPGKSVSDTEEFEGSLLNTMGATANCLLGVFAGLLLRNARFPARRKVFLLSAGGTLSLLLGYLWALQFPIVKLLWTSSYVLVTCGYSAILLAVCYLVIDIWKVRKWAAPFVWVGMNSITLYLAANIINFPRLATRLIGGAVFFGRYGDPMTAIVALALELSLAAFLYRRKIFLRL